MISKRFIVVHCVASKTKPERYCRIVQTHGEAIVEADFRIVMQGARRSNLCKECLRIVEGKSWD